MKRALIISTFLLLLSTSAFASNYTFEGAEQANFGKHTEVEDTYQAPSIENIKVNKDSAFIPPKFGSRTADTPETGELLTPNISDVPSMELGGAGGGEMQIYLPVDATSSIYTIPVASSWTSGIDIMQDDGSIGRLSIPKINLNAKVYEGEELSNLAKGLGHFTSTSAWDSNVALAGHNRGASAYFGRIHELQNGDVITYSTVLGSRTYAVVNIMQVDEYNTSVLYPTQENMITLITCVSDVPNMRWVVQAKQAW